MDATFDRAQAAYDAMEPDWSDEDDAQHEGDHEASLYDDNSDDDEWQPAVAGTPEDVYGGYERQP